MTSLKTLLQLPRGWQSSRQITGSDGSTLHLRATRKTAQCPECLKRSRSVHSCRRRRIQHLPCSGQTLWLIFAVRHWYCRNPSCTRKIFAESLVPFADPQQQSSTLLQNMQHQLELIAGGEAGRRAAVASGMQISADRRCLSHPGSPSDRPHRRSGCPEVHGFSAPSARSARTLRLHFRPTTYPAILSGLRC